MLGCIQSKVQSRSIKLKEKSQLKISNFLKRAPITKRWIRAGQSTRRLTNLNQDQDDLQPNNTKLTNQPLNYKIQQLPGVSKNLKENHLQRAECLIKIVSFNCRSEIKTRLFIPKKRQEITKVKAIYRKNCQIGTDLPVN